MHEMSIAHSILTEVERLIKVHEAKKALWVKIKVGVMSGVVPEQLLLAFDIYRKQFPQCEEMELRMEPVALKLLCSECGQESERDEMNLQCVHCHSFMVEILDGRDMIIEKLELDVG